MRLGRRFTSHTAHGAAMTPPESNPGMLGRKQVPGMSPFAPGIASCRNSVQRTRPNQEREASDLPGEQFHGDED